jgi:hypothetical protein
MELMGLPIEHNSLISWLLSFTFLLVLASEVPTAEVLGVPAGRASLVRWPIHPICDIVKPYDWKGHRE